MHSSGASRRDEVVCETIAASLRAALATKQSHFLCAEMDCFLCVEMDCFACVRNDGSNISHSPSSRAKGPLTRNDRVPTSAKRKSPARRGEPDEAFMPGRDLRITPAP